MTPLTDSLRPARDTLRIPESGACGVLENRAPKLSLVQTYEPQMRRFSLTESIIHVCFEGGPSGPTPQVGRSD